MDHLIFMDQPVQLVYIYISFTFAVVASVVHVGPHLQYLEGEAQEGLLSLSLSICSMHMCILMLHPLQPFALSIAPTQCYGLI